MTAREKFTKGQKVRATDIYRQRFPKSKMETGTVVGFGRAIVPGEYGSALVRVSADSGKGEPSTYNMDFWEPAE